MTEDASLIERLHYFAETTPNHEALVADKIRVSYEELAQLVQCQVNQLSQAGCTADSMVGIQCADDVQHLILCLALAYLGAGSCTLPAHETEQVQQSIIDHSGVTFVADERVAVAPGADTQDQGLHSVAAPSSNAYLLFSTSGTTGKPKLVLHQDRDIVAQAHRHIGSSAERFACLASMQHNFAKRHRLYCVAAGATNVFLDGKLESVVDRCLSLGVNVLHLSVFQAQELLALPGGNSLAGIRLKLGGSHASPTLRQQLRERITPVLQAGYGTTETGAIAFTDPDDKESADSVGRPLPGIQVKVVSADRTPLPRGQQGELAVKCDGMFRGYLGQEQLTQARLENGWFYTGDIAYLDREQRIFLCGRSDDMFVFNSMNIYPQDMESIICQHTDIADAAVIPSKSATHGDIPVALIVLKEGTKSDIAGLRKFMKQRLGLRHPRQITVVDAIPRNAAGKIVRQQAMNLAVESDDVRSVIAQVLFGHKKSRLKRNAIKTFEKGERDLVLNDIGLDSLVRMELLAALEVNFGKALPFSIFNHAESLSDLVNCMTSSETQDSLQGQNDTLAESDLSSNAVPPTEVKVLRRAVGYCHSVAELARLSRTLENRLTPLEVNKLRLWHRAGRLLPPNSDPSFEVFLRHWLEKQERLMKASGKSKLEPFSHYRTSPHLRYFIGPGSPENKTLLVCFAGRNNGCLLVPNAVLLQHTDATLYDVLVVAEPLEESYRLGVPFLGNSMSTMIEALGRFDFIKRYRAIRSLGASAGAYPALVAGFKFNAEVAVGIGGRFFRFQHHALKYLNSLWGLWQASRNGKCSRVILTYSPGMGRDRRFATIAGFLLGARLRAVEFADEGPRHELLLQLAERAALTSFLDQTVFVDLGDPLVNSHSV